MSKSRLTFFMASVFLLSGCATIQDLRNNQPDLDLTSVKKAKDVGVCIADRLEKMSTEMDTMSARQTSNGYSVVVTQNMPGGIYGSAKDTIIVVDITDTPSGSHTLFFNNFLAGGQKIFQAMRDCQSGSPVNAPTASTSTNSDKPILTDSSIPQKIRELENLRKDGLITDIEFQNKKKQLLDKL